MIRRLVLLAALGLVLPASACRAVPFHERRRMRLLLRGARAAVLALPLLAAACASAFQGRAEDGPSFPAAVEADNEIQVALGNYLQTDGGGNPRVKEGMRVVQPVVIFRRRVTEDAHLGGYVQFDSITAASAVGGPGGGAGGSAGPVAGDDDEDGDGGPGVDYAGAELNAELRTGPETSIGLALGGSVEETYRSRHARFSWSRDLFAKQVTVTLAARALDRMFRSDKLDATFFNLGYRCKF